MRGVMWLRKAFFYSPLHGGSLHRLAEVSTEFHGHRVIAAPEAGAAEQGAPRGLPLGVPARPLDEQVGGHFSVVAEDHGAAYAARLAPLSFAHRPRVGLCVRSRSVDAAAVVANVLTRGSLLDMACGQALDGVNLTASSSSCLEATLGRCKPMVMVDLTDEVGTERLPDCHLVVWPDPHFGGAMPEHAIAQRLRILFQTMAPTYHGAQHAPWIDRVLVPCGAARIVVGFRVLREAVWRLQLIEVCAPRVRCPMDIVLSVQCPGGAHVSRRQPRHQDAVMRAVTGDVTRHHFAMKVGDAIAERASTRCVLWSVLQPIVRHSLLETFQRKAPGGEGDAGEAVCLVSAPTRVPRGAWRQ